MAVSQLTRNMENAASATVSGAVTAGATTCTISSSTITWDNLPVGCIVWDTSYGTASAAKAASAYEKIWVTAATGTTVTTMARGKDGTTGIAWPVASGQSWQMDVAFTAEDYNEIDSKLTTAIAAADSRVVVTDATYGAVADGLTDNSSAFSSAITAANTAKTSTYVPGDSDAYMVDTVTLTDGHVVKIVGDGESLSTLKKVDSTDAMFVVASAETVELHLSDLTFDFDGSTVTDWETALFDVRVSRAVIRNCTFKNFRQAALKFQHVSDRVDILDCTFLDPIEHGGTEGQEPNAVHFAGLESQTEPDLYVRGCHFRSTNPSAAGRGAAGVIVNYVDAVRGGSLTVTDCVFDFFGQQSAGNEAACVHAYDDIDSVVVSGCKFFNLVGDAIRLQEVHGAAVTDCFVDGEAGNVGSGCYGVDISNRTTAQTSYGHVIRNVQIRNCASLDWGINVSGDAGAQISDLTIADCIIDGTVDGIYCKQVSDKVRIVGNKCVNLTGTNKTVLVEAISDECRLTLDGNHFEDCEGRVFIDGSGGGSLDLVVCNNVFDNIANSQTTESLLRVATANRLTFYGNIYKGVNTGEAGMETTSISEILSPIDVKQFGAQGDGTVGGSGTLDTKAVQEAFDAAQMIGGAVYFPAGSYRVGQITVGTSVKRVYGDGEGSVLIQTAWGADILYFDDSDGVAIENLFFQGQPTTTEISSSSNAGINYTSSTAGATGIGNAGKITVRNCTFKQLRYCGSIIEFSDSVVFDGNDIDTCLFGALFYFNHNVRITNNTMNESMSAGQIARAESGYPELSVGFSVNNGTTVTTAHNSRVVFSGNTVTEWKFGQPLLVHDAISVSISDNHFEEVLYGFSVFPASSNAAQKLSEVTIIGNTMRHDTDAPNANQEEQAGASFTLGGNTANATTLDRLTVCGNTIYGCNIGPQTTTKAAISLNSEVEQAAITGNVIEYVAGNAIWLSTGSTNINVTGNTIHNVDADGNSRRNGIFINGADPVSGLISNNVINDANFGIRIDSGPDISGLMIGDNHMTNVTTRISNASSSNYQATNAYAGIYMNGNASAEDGDTPAAFKVIANWDADGEEHGVTAAFASGKVTTVVGGKYLVTASLAYKGTISRTIEFAVFVDGVQTKLKSTEVLTDALEHSCSISGVVSADAAEDVDLRWKSSADNDDTVVIVDANFDVVLVGR